MTTTTLERPASLTTEPTGSRDSRPYPIPPEESFRDPAWTLPDADTLNEGEDPPEWPLLDYLAADELARLARRLITTNERFTHLRNWQIEVRWKREGGKNRDGLRYGATTKPSGLLRHFAGCDFVVWLAADHHRDTISTYRQVEACLFHELLHCGES